MAQSSFAVRVATLVSCAATFGLAACSSDTLVPTAAPPASASLDAGGVPNGGNGNGNAFAFGHVKVCAAPISGEAECHSWITVDDKGQPSVASAPAGYNPVDLQSAYGLSAGSSGTVAIVDAFDDPNAESDLAVYRAKFGLPPCTTAGGCFKKVSAGSGFLRANASWAEEISLDLDMVSAICPACHILLVEATSNSDANLYAAENKAAATTGVVAISNSWGGNEYSGETSDELTYFNHPGIAITVSSGDGGYGVEFPAASRYVTAVGGTHLTRSGSSWNETAWSGAGSGCSSMISKPSWQHDTGCTKNRTVADVSAVADPNTGVSVYDTYGLRHGGWLVFGGTSVASPIIASVYALAGNTTGINYGSFSYSHLGGLFDVLSGSNGSCGGSYLCTSGGGYDGPTGNGSPRGTGAF